MDRTISIELTVTQAEKLMDMIDEWNSEYAWGSDKEANTIFDIIASAPEVDGSEDE